jgi:hypothetical protein
MSSGITETPISNGVEDIGGITIHCTPGAVILSEDTIVGQALRLPGSATDAVALQLRGVRSENVKSSHQFLARFHRLRRIHPTEHFFPPLTIHRCEFAHEPVARFPFCVFAGANAQREQGGGDPNGNVGRGNEKHGKR